MVEYDNTNNPLTGAPVDLGLQTQFHTRLGDDIESALDPQQEEQQQQGVQAPVDESEEVKWETPTRPFKWASVLAGAALGGLGHYTGNKHILPTFLKDQKEQRVKYEQRMGRLQEIQAIAGSSSALLKHLEMVGGGDPNKGARIMAKQSPEALQKTLASWENSSTALQFAKNINSENKELISDESLARYEKLGKGLTMGMVSGGMELGFKARAEDSRAEAMDLKRADTELNKVHFVFQQHMAAEQDVDEARRRTIEDTGVDPFAPTVGKFNLADTEDLKAHEGGLGLEAQQTRFIKGVVTDEEIRKRESTSKAILKVSESTGDPTTLFNAALDGLVKPDGDGETSPARTQSILKIVEKNPDFINMRGAISEVSKIATEVANILGDTGNLNSIGGISDAMNENTELAGRWEMLTPEQKQFVVEKGPHLVEDGVSAMNSTTFLKYALDNPTHLLAGEDSLHTLFKGLTPEQLVKNRERGTQRVAAKRSAENEFAKATKALNLGLPKDWLESNINFSSLSEKDLQGIQQGLWPEHITGMLTTAFEGKYGSDTEGMEKAASAISTTDFAQMPQQLKAAFLKKLFPKDKLAESQRSIDALSSTANLDARINTASAEARKAVLEAPQTTGFDAGLIHDSSFRTGEGWNSDQWSNKMTEAFFDVLYRKELFNQNDPKVKEAQKLAHKYSAFMDRGTMLSIRPVWLGTTPSPRGYVHARERVIPGGTTAGRDGGEMAKFHGILSSHEQDPVTMLTYMQELTGLEIGNVEGKSVNLIDWVLDNAATTSSPFVADLRKQWNSRAGKTARSAGYQAANFQEAYDSDTGRVTFGVAGETEQGLAQDNAVNLTDFTDNVSALYTVGGTAAFGEDRINQLKEIRSLKQSQLTILHTAGGPGADALKSVVGEQITQLDLLLGNSTTRGSIADADAQLDRIRFQADEDGSRFFLGLASNHTDKPITGFVVWGKDERGLVASPDDEIRMKMLPNDLQGTNPIVRYQKALQEGPDTPLSIKEEVSSLIGPNGALNWSVARQWVATSTGETTYDNAFGNMLSGEKLSQLLKDVDKIHANNMAKSIEQLIADYQEVNKGNELLSAEIKRLLTVDDASDQTKYKYRLSYQTISGSIRNSLVRTKTGNKALGN